MLYEGLEAVTIAGVRLMVDDLFRAKVNDDEVWGGFKTELTRTQVAPNGDNVWHLIHFVEYR